METCILSVQEWMSRHFLKMNNDKTDFLVISSRQMRERIPPLSLQIGSNHIDPSPPARNLRVQMSSMASSMERQISQVCRSSLPTSSSKAFTEYAATLISPPSRVSCMLSSHRSLTFAMHYTWASLQIKYIGSSSSRTPLHASSVALAGESIPPLCSDSCTGYRWISV